ncbi:hypothetical protein WA026_013737 [Henosepilachna vigintioctopunctata]|uniref:Protein Jumonji n=1 Tax=Henosepilachna vigintioctopunctata TaxID=420089 RepID=A0AAW1V0X9_9CUCU
MKRKRREQCPSPLLDEPPKRTKVHAQRKFAQGSNVNSPVITPVKEFERIDRSSLDLVPEPVELLPIRRPNTEDFLTFLCFRGTPLLPPNLNFFNTASIVDTNGQVHEIKSESPKNGPIDTSVITKGGSGPSDRPFIAFGVRKRADPIVISRQMEKKRRHALALQALRRKYQEQKMAKIRAVTISKLSEKPSNRASVRSNSISKVVKVQPTVTEKPDVQKNKFISSKNIQVTTQSMRTVSSKIKPRMCLRSFRGRFVQQELPFRAVKKLKIPDNKMILKKNIKKKEDVRKPVETIPLTKNAIASTEKKLVRMLKQKEVKVKNHDVRVLRSNNIPVKSQLKVKKIVKRRILIPHSSTLVKSRVLRSETSKNNCSQSRRSRRRLNSNSDPSVLREKLPKRFHKKINNTVQKGSKLEQKLKSVEKKTEESIKEKKKVASVLQNVEALNSDVSKIEPEVVKTNKLYNTSDRVLRNENITNSKNVKDKKSKQVKQTNVDSIKKEIVKLAQNIEQKFDNKKTAGKSKVEEQKSTDKSKISSEDLNKKELNKVLSTKKSKVIESKPNDIPKVKENKDITTTQEGIQEQEDIKEQRCSQRPSRKTKEAAAIYMEILSHKLVNEKKTDDDNVSIDSFPELPNVKRTEQRENELKAKANISKVGKINKQENLEKVETIMYCSFEKYIEKNKISRNDADSQSDSECKKKLVKMQPIRRGKIKDSNKNPELVIPERPLLNDKIITGNVENRPDLKESNFTNTIINAELNSENLKLELENANIQKDIKDEVIIEKAFREQLEKTVNNKVEKELLENKLNDCDDKEKLGEESSSDVHIFMQNAKKSSVKDHKKEMTNEMELNSRSTEKKIAATDDNLTHRKKGTINTDKCILQVGNQIKQNSISKDTYSDNSTDSDEVLANIPKLNKDFRSKATDEKKKNISEKIIDSKTNIKEKHKFDIIPDSDDECLANISKNKHFKSKTTLPCNIQTKRNIHKNTQAESDGTEDSINLDIKVPKKKLATRSRSSKSNEFTSSKYKSNSPKSFIKKTTNVMKDNNFSDSDEEPLSKFTSIKRDALKSTKELKEDILRKQKALIESPPHKTKFKKISKNKDKITGENIKNCSDKETSTSTGKPKRECAKLPSNYLPMFSSSDDEEKFFHGFSTKDNTKIGSIYSHSSLDFLSKGLGRRFGKEKVNMSKEQIERWLKDSAMAGDDGKKDEELKFCEEIPTETSLNTTTTIDTEKLKTSLLNIQKVSNTKESISEEKKSPDHENAPKSPVYKSPGDRKPIFKKEKAKAAPTVGAFSANNESSIYAFEEEIDDVVSTPFRRPTRRPSSTATSKSEDEFSKSEEQMKLGQFRKPIVKNDSVKEELKPKTKETEAIMIKQTLTSQKPVLKASRSAVVKTLKRSNSDHLEDIKYKVPSSPSASSSSSAKLYKKQNKQKAKIIEGCNPIKMAEFPCNGPGELVEAPTFYPTEKEFQDPLEYIEKIGAKAEQFGICKIVPPSTFKPECKVSDDMRFTAYNQYVHKMLHRWGPNFKELMAIKKYLQTQNINLTQPPWIGGMEVDLPRLYQTVQSLGGLKEVIEKEKWSKVSDIMRIPKSAQDRVTKLDDIYCKYLLPYDTLSPDEREKLLDEVETEWAKRESKTLLTMQKSETAELDNDSDSEYDNEAEECITKGRNMALNAFYRIARNTMSMWFKNSGPTAQEIEQEFWKHVVQRQNHICVHSGSIDSGSWGYGFAVSKNSPFARHAWNLKVLTNNSGSVLRSLGPLMGVTVPTLHVGMVFSACCWYRDPHSLPWIEYLHTGGNKIWYGIPNSVGDLFKKALMKFVPNYCRNRGVWLPSDTVMLPPSVLIESGVSLSRTVQEPGQFIVVFPKAFTSSLSTGYVVSESVFFAPPAWLKTAQVSFDLLRDSCEPSMFSLDRLFISIMNDQRTSVEVLKQMIPIVTAICSKEKPKRILYDHLE